MVATLRLTCGNVGGNFQRSDMHAGYSDCDILVALFAISSTALLQNFHWLPIEWRVHFKLATLAYKALHTGQPPYLSELLQHYEPIRTLSILARVHFESQHQKYGTYCLPIPTFRRHLKTHYFQSA